MKHMRPMNIYYTPYEVGPAEYLGGNLARILKAPVFAKHLCLDDIVGLDFVPVDGSHPSARVVQIVHSRHQKNTRLWYANQQQFVILKAILALLGGECHVVTRAKRGVRGCLSIGHPAAIEVPLLAEAIGICQYESDDETAISPAPPATPPCHEQNTPQPS
jgi:hypothetical protein